MPKDTDNVLSDQQLSKTGRWVPFASSRVTEGRYDEGLQQIHVIFRDGTPWVYDHVPRDVWRRFKTSSSAGKFVDRVLNGYPYYRGGFDYGSSADLGDEE